ncbi:MAG: ABC transporter ATP-binding protein [Pseudonocardiales bacterium]|nr:ABC transporter ATP-binding protein [Pseudonocardiales bacterium]
MRRRIELAGVAKSFGRTVALDGIDLTVEPGEHFALLGPSGSGKSTLLRVVAGLEAPDDGDVRFDGESQAGVEVHRRDVSLVFQQYALYPHLTALRNITLGLRHGLGLPAAEADRRAREVAGTLGVADLLDRRPRAMSGGQRQRIALARALARRAGIVLLDEPLSGLDAQLRLVLRVEIARHLRGSGATTVHVTHDQSDALTSADRIGVMQSGRIAQLGTPDELYDRPANLFVARFVGTPPMNTFPVTPAGSVFGVHPDLAPDTVLGVRPEHLRLDAHGAWRAAARVEAVEHAGPERIVHLWVDGTPARSRTDRSGVAVGDVLTVSADPGQVHVFAGPDGLRQGSALGAGAPVEPVGAH